ncbi:proximal tail tube connector protein [Curtobacterium phage Ayka]|nr:proximal tail tube connector protein [Curtobacterium phage Ayka]
MTGAVFTIRLKKVLDYTHADIETGEGIGLDLYPIFDESYRAGLNKKIIQHYWNREIGRETIEDFRFALMRTMNEIMPLYNQLYETQKLKFDPLSTMDISTVSSDNGENVSNGKSESDTSGDSEASGLNVSNTFPQTALKNNDNANYADSGAESATKSKQTGKVNENRDESLKTKSNAQSATKGYTGPASELLMRYRATLLNIDMLIVNELNLLFMNVWDNGDTYTESGFVL